MLWSGVAVGLAPRAGAFASQNQIGQNRGQGDRRLSAGLPAATHQQKPEHCQCAGTGVCGGNQHYSGHPK